jgi:hypothetical protein
MWVKRKNEEVSSANSWFVRVTGHLRTGARFSVRGVICPVVDGTLLNPVPKTDCQFFCVELLV